MGELQNRSSSHPVWEAGTCESIAESHNHSSFHAKGSRVGINPDLDCTNVLSPFARAGDNASMAGLHDTFSSHAEVMCDGSLLNTELRLTSLVSKAGAYGSIVASNDNLSSHVELMSSGSLLDMQVDRPGLDSTNICPDSEVGVCASMAEIHDHSCSHLEPMNKGSRLDMQVHHSAIHPDINSDDILGPILKNEDSESMAGIHDHSCSHMQLMPETSQLDMRVDCSAIRPGMNSTDLFSPVLKDRASAFVVGLDTADHANSHSAFPGPSVRLTSEAFPPDMQVGHGAIISGLNSPNLLASVVRPEASTSISGLQNMDFSKSYLAFSGPSIELTNKGSRLYMGVDHSTTSGYQQWDAAIHPNLNSTDLLDCGKDIEPANLLPSLEHRQKLHAPDRFVFGNSSSVESEGNMEEINDMSEHEQSLHLYSHLQDFRRHHAQEQTPMLVDLDCNLPFFLAELGDAFEDVHAWQAMRNTQGLSKLHHKRLKVLLNQQLCGDSRQGPFPTATIGSSQQNENDDQGSPSLRPYSWSSQEDEEHELAHCDAENDDDDNRSVNGDPVSDENQINESRMELTDDLLLMVFSFLDQTGLCKAAMVCQQWRSASGHEDFWRSLDFEGHVVTQEQARRLCTRYPKAVQLNLKGVPSADELARDAIHSLRYLERLTLGDGTLSDTLFVSLANECPSLQKLIITDAIFGICGSQEIQVRHDSLRYLQVTNSRLIRISIRCPLLDDLSLRGTTMASLLLVCPQLLSLDVSHCHKLSDAGVRAAATSCPSLTSLNIKECSYVSDESLREISAACPSLQILDASNCPNISLEGVRMPMLTELKLNNCEGINSSSITALSHCYTLESIQLNHCLLLTTVNLVLPRLQSISLIDCRKFVDLTIHSPSLVNVDFAKCLVLVRIEIFSSALKKLVLHGQQSLTTLTLHCPQLQEIDIMECDSLTNSICEVLSEEGGCPRLNTLILENCESLTMAKLCSTSLKTLSLVGCRNICSIDLVCPNIQQLYLDGCDHLTTATLFPVGLEYLNLGICPRLTKLKIDAPYMTSLDLKGCGVLCKAEILCPKLLSLDAFYCSSLDDSCLQATTIACPLIQSLILASCPSIGPSGLLSLQNLSNLTMLDLSYTFLTDLSPVFQTCPRLKVLRLLACKYLDDNALDALHGGKSLPDLRELDLSYGSLCQASLEGLLICCPHLTHVSFSGCANLYDLNWEQKHSSEVDKMVEKSLGTVADIEHLQEVYSENVRKIEEPSAAENSLVKIGLVRALQHLNCVGCPNIRRVVIPFSAGCIRLSSLNLSLSCNVKVIRLACYNLNTLNLSKCTALEEIRLSCPRLTSLSLQACGIEERMLESALEGCSSLETLDVRNCIKISAAALSQARALCPRLKRVVNSIVFC